jgi:hypothetical protein
VLLSNLEESDGDGARWWWMGGIVKVSSSRSYLPMSTDLYRFLVDHFGGPAIEQSLSSLSLTEQMEETPTNLITPIRPRIASSTSTVARTPDQTDGSPQKGGETSGSPLTPLRFIKKASDSPDVRQKEKAILRIGRRSILGKE